MSVDLTIKILEEKDVGKDYVEWFLDTEIVRFSENQYKKFTLDGQKKYVKNCKKYQKTITKCIGCCRRRSSKATTH